MHGEGCKRDVLLQLDVVPDYPMSCGEIVSLQRRAYVPLLKRVVNRQVEYATTGGLLEWFCCAAYQQRKEGWKKESVSPLF
jgi:hypothetical protein